MEASFDKIPRTPENSLSCHEFTSSIFDCPYHYHPEYEITYIQSSFGRRFVGDHIGLFNEGDLVLHGINLPHLYYNDNKESLSGTWAHSIVIQFSENCLGESFFYKPELETIASMLKRSTRGIRFFGINRDEVVHDIRAITKTQGMERIILFLKILHRLSKTKNYELLASPGFAISRNMPFADKLNVVCDYLNKHFHKELPQTEVAQLINMTPASFSRFFHQCTGKTFSAFLNEIRVGHACRLLIESDASILDICYTSGFSNLSNFNRRFKELRDYAPREYRKAFIKGTLKETDF